MNDDITSKAHTLAVEIIKEFEGLRLEAYRDAIGVLTIGYGTTHIRGGSPIHGGAKISKKMAEEFLSNDMHKFEAGIGQHVLVNLNDNENAALISFTYNLGLGNLYHSHLLTYINHQDFTRAALEFRKWNHAGGKVIDGLTRRRKMEQELFMRNT
jgi:lysozyme